MRFNLKVIYKIIFVVTFIAGGMFSNATSANVIGELPSTTLITCNPTSVVFTGEEIKPCTATVTGLGDPLLNESIPVTYTDNINAGTATVKATFDGNDIYSASSDEKTFTITKANPTFHYNSVYDGTLHYINVNNIIIKGVLGQILDPSALNLGDTIEAHRNAGDYSSVDSFNYYLPCNNTDMPCHPSYSLGTNYNTIIKGFINNIITKKPITVTAVANTKNEDGNTTAAAIPTITSGSLAEGDTAVLTESYTDATAGENKTLEPKIVITDGNNGNNYEVTYENVNTGTILPVKKSTKSSSGSYIVMPTFINNIAPTPVTTTPAPEGSVLGAEKYNFVGYLKMWTYGNEVTELQKFLMGAGFDCKYVDGKYGPLTKAAVIKFQIANKLEGDGIVGEKTRAILNK